MPETVRIHKVAEIPAGVAGAKAVDQVAIIYSTPEIPPRTVFIDKDKDTPEERQRVIKEDLEVVDATGKEFLDIP